MNQQEAMDLFQQGFDCSQAVLMEFADELNLDDETAKKISACFGGGIWNGHVCGAVTGAMMVIGMKYGHSQAGDKETKDLMVQKINEFITAFEQKHGSVVCKDLLGYKIPEDLDTIMEKQLFFTEGMCPAFVCDAIDILHDIL
jgi:C_GCAxxG_C_C family probable redox protein